MTFEDRLDNIGSLAADGALAVLLLMLAPFFLPFAIFGWLLRKLYAAVER